MDDVVKYLKALVALQVSAMFGAEGQKPELLLKSAGLKAQEIAELLGKSTEAVQKMISRAK